MVATSQELDREATAQKGAGRGGQDLSSVLSYSVIAVLNA